MSPASSPSAQHYPFAHGDAALTSAWSCLSDHTPVPAGQTGASPVITGKWNRPVQDADFFITCICSQGRMYGQGYC